MTSHREGGATTAPDTWDLYTRYGTAPLTEGETEWTYDITVCDICAAVVLGIEEQQQLHYRWHNVTGTNPWGNS